MIGTKPDAEPEGDQKRQVSGLDPDPARTVSVADHRTAISRHSLRRFESFPAHQVRAQVDPTADLRARVDRRRSVTTREVGPSPTIR